jgi:hypothetical protein
MIDRYTKAILTIIAISLAWIAFDSMKRYVIPEANAQGLVLVRVVGGNLDSVNGTVDVRVRGGRLDYETDVSGGPTLKVCTSC